MPSWGEFHQERHRAERPDEVDFDDICSRVFSMPAGRELIEALRQKYVEAAENPLATESALRVRVTQQQFVRDLENARDRGLEAAKRRAEASSKSP